MWLCFVCIVRSAPVGFNSVCCVSLYAVYVVLKGLLLYFACLVGCCLLGCCDAVMVLSLSLFCFGYYFRGCSYCLLLG